LSISSIDDPSPFAAVGDGVRIRVHARPGARRDAIEGLRPEADGSVALKLAVRAVPEDGKANAAIAKLLAAEWKMPQSALRLIGGAQDRRKLFHLAGEPRALLARLEGWLRQWTEQA
jgi:uncharacterized protein YggU (UPF0235/DUF167 family)